MANKDKKELLIQTAIDLFSKKGYQDASIRDIGEAAKVNTSLFYHYFSDKEEILYIIIERFSKYLVNVLKEIQSKESDPLECLKKMITRHVSFCREFKKESKVTVEENYWLRGRRRADCIWMQREVYDIYMNQLKQLEQSNILRNVNLSILNFVILGMINWFYRWYKEGKPLGEEDIADQMVKILFWGVVREHGKNGKI